MWPESRPPGRTGGSPWADCSSPSGRSSSVAGRWPDAISPCSFMLGTVLIIRRLSLVRWGVRVPEIAATAVVLVGVWLHRTRTGTPPTVGTARGRSPLGTNARCASGVVSVDRLAVQQSWTACASPPRGRSSTRVDGRREDRRDIVGSGNPWYCRGPGNCTFSIPTVLPTRWLARLPPAVGERWQWSIERRVPEGYTDSLPERPIALTEPPLASLDERHLRVATRAPRCSQAGSRCCSGCRRRRQRVWLGHLVRSPGPALA